MFNFEVISIVIGLVFVYLLYSLLATILQEILATWFHFRGKVLEITICRMLQDEIQRGTLWGLVRRLLCRSDEKNLEDLQKKGTGAATLENLPLKFYKHPAIRQLVEGTSKNKPSYLRKETFAKVIIDLLRGNDVKVGEDYRQKIQDELWHNPKVHNSDTISYFQSIWVDAQGDLDKFRDFLEDWFVESMDRASSWYKKYTQALLLCLGFIIAAAFNVDTIEIVSKLSKDSELREQVVLQADNFLKANPNLNEQLQETQRYLADSTQDTLQLSNLKQDSIRFTQLINRQDELLEQANNLINQDIDKVNNLLGLGWSDFQSPDSKGIIEFIWCILAFICKHLIGWLLTALAISLGAPFWFDLLNKLMKVRASVALPASADKSKDAAPAAAKVPRKITRHG